MNGPVWAHYTPTLGLFHLEHRTGAVRLSFFSPMQSVTPRVGAFFAAMLLLLGVCSHEVAAQSNNVQYLLGPGDEVRITVFGEPDMSGQFKIDGGGNIGLPLIGNVQAGGRSPRDLEAAIAQRLKQGYLVNPQVTAEVMNYRPFYILGEVKKPGSYPYVEGMTAINAVALAGGYTYRARENQMLITRAGDTQKQRASPDTVLLPGDVVEIPERFF